MAKFGAHCEELLPSIIVLLQRCLLDTDDEVRDRATFYVNVLKQKQMAMNSAYILNGLQVSIVGLEKALHNYTLEPTNKPFDLKSVPLATQTITEQKTSISSTPGAVTQPKPSREKIANTTQDIYAEQLAGIPEFASLGPLFKSSTTPIELTESETEYVVRCIKHTFQQHIVFQFDCMNTLNDQVLENVSVHMETGDGFEIVKYIPASALKYSVSGITYTCVHIPEDPSLVTATFTCTMKFLVKDCDPNTGEPDDEGYEDEYVLEDVEISVSDHVQKVMKPNFAASWEELGPENELEDTYALSSMKTLEDAVKNIIQFMGLQPCERTDKVPDNKSSHTLLLAGVYRGGYDVLVRAKLALADGVTMQITVRSNDPHACDVIASAVG